ncbi:unnamed protein product [Amoebophrya sp. A25]|nr:unnamed protein product [Amoebophrya sp. A25]|eukprot:GSA25T00002841001.1
MSRIRRRLVSPPFFLLLVFFELSLSSKVVEGLQNVSQEHPQNYLTEDSARVTSKWEEDEDGTSFQQPQRVHSRCSTSNEKKKKTSPRIWALTSWGLETNATSATMPHWLYHHEFRLQLDPQSFIILLFSRSRHRVAHFVNERLCGYETETGNAALSSLSTSRGITNHVFADYVPYTTARMIQSRLFVLEAVGVQPDDWILQADGDELAMFPGMFLPPLAPGENDWRASGEKAEHEERERRDLDVVGDDDAGGDHQTGKLDVNEKTNTQEELDSFPLRDFVQNLELNGENIVFATLVERIAADGNLERPVDPLALGKMTSDGHDATSSTSRRNRRQEDLFYQYPLSCALQHMTMGSDPLKVILYKAALRSAGHDVFARLAAGFFPRHHVPPQWFDVPGGSDLWWKKNREATMTPEFVDGASKTSSKESAENNQPDVSKKNLVPPTSAVEWASGQNDHESSNDVGTSTSTSAQERQQQQQQSSLYANAGFYTLEDDFAVAQGRGVGTIDSSGEEDGPPTETYLALPAPDFAGGHTVLVPRLFHKQAARSVKELNKHRYNSGPPSVGDKRDWTDAWSQHRYARNALLEEHYVASGGDMRDWDRMQYHSSLGNGDVQSRIASGLLQQAMQRNLRAASLERTRRQSVEDHEPPSLDELSPVYSDSFRRQVRNLATVDRNGLYYGDHRSLLAFGNVVAGEGSDDEVLPHDDEEDDAFFEGDNDFPKSEEYLHFIAEDKLRDKRQLALAASSTKIPLWLKLWVHTLPPPDSDQNKEKRRVRPSKIPFARPYFGVALLFHFKWTQGVTKKHVYLTQSEGLYREFRDGAVAYTDTMEKLMSSQGSSSTTGQDGDDTVVKSEDEKLNSAHRPKDDGPEDDVASLRTNKNPSPASFITPEDREATCLPHNPDQPVGTLSLRDRFRLFILDPRPEGTLKLHNFFGAPESIVGGAILDAHFVRILLFGWAREMDRWEKSEGGSF